MAKRDIKGTAFNSGVFPERLKMALHGQVGKYKGTVITQKQLANDIGVKPQTIGQYVNSVSLPGAQNLADIADYFGLSADYLLGITDVQSPSAQMAADYLGLSEIGIDRIKRIKDKKLLETVLYSDSFYEILSVLNVAINTADERRAKLAELEKMALELGVTINSVHEELEECCSNLAGELELYVRNKSYESEIYTKNSKWEFPSNATEAVEMYYKLGDREIPSVITQEMIDDAQEFYERFRENYNYEPYLSDVYDFEEAKNNGAD